MGKLLAELKRRNVFRVLLAYVAAAWLVLQACDLLVDALDLPPLLLRVVFALSVLGLVPAVLLSWLYQLTPEGLRRDSDTVTEPGRAVLSARRLDHLLIAVLAVVVLMLLAQRLLPGEPHASAAPPEATDAAPAASTGPPPPDAGAVPDTAIAVLPFRDLSAAADQDHFSDGLAEELIGLLASVPQLHVVGRISSFRFRDEGDLRLIGRELGVAHVLEGSVRRSDARLRVGVQLVDVRSGFHVWSSTYERELSDVFELQEDIAQAVVAALKVELLPDQSPPSAEHRPANAAAYEEYLLGRKLAEQGTADAVALAIAAFERALGHDPDYAAAHAALSTMQVFAVDTAADAAALQEHARRALLAAERAIEIDPQLALGYQARAGVRQSLVWDFAGARADVQRALALEPANPRVQRQAAILMANLGDFSAAIDAARRACAADPVSAASWNLLGYFLVLRGERIEGEAALQRALQIAPQRVVTLYALGETAVVAGDAAAALDYAQRMPEGDVFREVLEALARHDRGERAASDAALARLVERHAHHSAFQIAEVHAWRGEVDRAFEWLERAYAQHDGGLQTLRYDPLLAPLRADRRFAALVERLGLDLR